MDTPGSSLTDHMRGSKHRTRAQEVSARAALSNYHSNFSKLPPNQQAHTIYFTAKKKNMEEVRCKLCKQTLKYTDLDEHILGENHRDAIETRLQNYKFARQEPLLYKAIRVYSDVEGETSLQTEVSVASTSVTVTDVSVASTSSNSVTVTSSHTTTNSSESAEDENKPAEFKFNFSIPQEEEIAVAEPENVPNTTIDSPQEQPSESLSYDPLILEVTYPERIRTMSYQIDNIPYYTIQVMSESECCCLLCRCGLEGRTNSIKIHLRGLKHQRNATVGETYLALKEYHIGFMRLPIQLQPHVIYFSPSAQKKAHCKLCGDNVMYGAMLEAHIFGNTHKIGVLKRMQYGVYHVKDTLLKRALKIYPEENEERSDENSGSPTMNGVVEVTKSGAASTKRPVHDIVTSITNLESQSFFDRLENRFRSHLNLLEERPTDVHCKCCNVTIMKTCYDVKKHIISEEHKKKAGVPNKRYKYVCDVCTLTQRKEASWQEHFQLEPHNRRLEEIPPVKREYLTEYECRTCNVIIFGDTVALRKHRSFIRNRQNTKFRKEITLNEHAKLLFKSEEHINALSTQLVWNANEVVERQDNVWTCCKAIEMALSKVFENCHAYPFGSRVSGLGNMNSDLDVFVDVGDMYLGLKNQDAKSQERIVKEAAKVFRKFPGRVFTHVNPVPTARTPIVQIFHTVTLLDCDLSFRHGLSVENTKLLRVCIGLQPITQYLILMLKQWSQFSKLDENITTYALSMMTIFYLQTRGFLLSIKQLKTLNPEPPQVIDGWETINYTLSFEAMKEHITPFTGTLKELLSDFFKYYFEFKFETEVVCPLLGHTIKKSDFNGSATGDLLPPEMHTYIVKLRTEKEPELFRALSPLCVQDPFDLSHNLTKACSDYVVEKFQTLCDLSVKYLASVN